MLTLPFLSQEDTALVVPLTFDPMARFCAVEYDDGTSKQAANAQKTTTSTQWNVISFFEGFADLQDSGVQARREATIVSPGHHP